MFSKQILKNILLKKLFSITNTIKAFKTKQHIYIFLAVLY